VLLSDIDGTLRATILQEDGTTREKSLDIVNYATDFNSRNKGIIDTPALQTRAVLIVGLGSIGSSVAVCLLRSGVTRFHLIELDIVSVGNICRSEYDLLDIGQAKTDALSRKLSHINPSADIHLYNEDVLEMDSEILTEVIESSDLIIDATDSYRTKILINGMAYHTKPVIYSSVYDSGRGGDILFTLPGLPCYECIFKPIIDDMKALKKGEWDYTSGKAKPMPALLADIQVIVARTVKIALGLLTADTELSFIESITEPGCSMLFVGNERDVHVMEKPFQEAWAETETNQECSCQTLR